MRNHNLALAVMNRRSETASDTESGAKRTRISVVVADGDSIVRCGLKYVIESAEQFEHLGEAGNADSALEEIARVQPNVALLSDHLGDASLIDVLTAAMAQSPSTHFLVLADEGRGSAVQALLQAGVKGYCLRNTAPATLVNALYAVSQGAIWIDPSLSSFIANLASTQVPRKDDAPALSERELEVLRLVAEGLGNVQIAQKLFVSPETVKTHVKHIMEKLAATDRTEAAVKAIRNGLV